MRLQIAIAIALTSLLAACGGAVRSGVQAEQSSDLVFTPSVHPYGASMVTWSERWWQWLLETPAATNPFLDPTGAECAVAQQGKAWYLAPFIGGSATRSCTIPSGKALLVNLSGILNDYPCPDPSFQPAPGQSLEDFLAAGAKAVVDGVNELTLTIDGVTVPNPFDYRVRSPLFYFQGDASLQTQVDACITGAQQPAVSDGFWVMVKPLPSGSHVLTATAGDVGGVHVVVTWNLTVAGEE
jgi:hypothetical protein